MNNFFINITTDLELKKDSKCKLNNLEDILKAFESHTNIEKKSNKLSILLKNSLFVL